MRPVGGASTRWAERLDRAGPELEPSADAALAGASVEDGVDPHTLLDAGTDAVAAVAGRGRSTGRAVAMFRALAEARDEIPELAAEFGELTEALERARSQIAGELGAVLDRYIELRRRVASGVGSISTG